MIRSSEMMAYRMLAYVLRSSSFAIQAKRRNTQIESYVTGMLQNLRHPSVTKYDATVIVGDHSVV